MTIEKGNDYSQIEIQDNHELVSYRDILVLPPNVHGGEDKIIGDVHGNLDCLHAVLNTLEERDRLFIAGDLLDRGDANRDIVHAILAYQADHPDQLYVVAGNHEQLCYKAILALETLFSELAKIPHDQSSSPAPQSTNDWVKAFMAMDQKVLLLLYPDTPISDLRAHLINGGAWLVELFYQEMVKRLIMNDDSRGLLYAKDSRIGEMKCYIPSLPYIIHVRGERPFNVVHADMPINDDVLLERLQGNQYQLSTGERTYATWAREKETTILIQPNGRTAGSTRTYVGHSIIAFGQFSPVRADTNTVDIDVATYQSGVSLVIHHHLGRGVLLGPGVERVDQYPGLIAALTQINTFLQPASLVKSAGQHGLFALTEQEEGAPAEHVKEKKEVRHNL